MNPELLETVLQQALSVPASSLPGFIGQLETIRVTALMRLQTQSAPQNARQADELLGIKEAARRLGVSKDFLYRHAGEFAFVRRVGSRLLFSAHGIAEHIAGKV